jgi:phenylpyruvate tautomerase PptA (4-oxalocrotonate tautomerase family)
MPLAKIHVLEGRYNRDRLALVTEIRDYLARIAPHDTPIAQSEECTSSK